MLTSPREGLAEFPLGFRYTSCPVPKEEDTDSPLCHHPISAMSQRALEASVEDHLEFAHGAIIDEAVARQ